MAYYWHYKSSNRTNNNNKIKGIKMVLKNRFHSFYGRISPQLIFIEIYNFMQKIQRITEA